MKHIRGNVVAYLALFFAVGGAGAYAAAQIGSGDIKRDAVRARHVKNGSLGQADVKARQFPPAAYARILSPTGNPDLVDETRAKGISAADVTHIDEGTYCVDLAFTPKAVSATLEANSSMDQVVQASLNALSGCAGSDDAKIVIYDISTATEIDAAFYAAFFR